MSEPRTPDQGGREKRAVIYTRVAGSHDVTVGTDAQDRRCREECARRGLTVELAVHDQGWFRPDERPWQDVADSIRARQVDVLVIDSLSRVGRGHGDLRAVVDLCASCGVSLLAVDVVHHLLGETDR